MVDVTRDRRILSADAQQLLDNALLKGAFSALADYLETQALTCSPDDPSKAQRIVISKQLLAGLKREIYRYVEDGMVAEMQEIEMRKVQQAAFQR
jgi:hypothetical protein